MLDPRTGPRDAALFRLLCEARNQLLHFGAEAGADERLERVCHLRPESERPERREQALIACRRLDVAPASELEEPVSAPGEQSGRPSLAGQLRGLCGEPATVLLLAARRRDLSQNRARLPREADQARPAARRQDIAVSRDRACPMPGLEVHPRYVGALAGGKEQRIRRPELLVPPSTPPASVGETTEGEEAFEPDVVDGDVGVGARCPAELAEVVDKVVGAPEQRQRGFNLPHGEQHQATTDRKRRVRFAEELGQPLEPL